MAFFYQLTITYNNAGRFNNMKRPAEMVLTYPTVGWNLRGLTSQHAANPGFIESCFSATA